MNAAPRSMVGAYGQEKDASAYPEVSANLARSFNAVRGLVAASNECGE